MIEALSRIELQTIIIACSFFIYGSDPRVEY
nr:MAG TPA: hypothetical protein [Caudoviricetes sp.]